MTCYYNEHDPKAAAWLRELIRRNLIAPGDVDERSIVDARADDLRGYDQWHMFAGIGIWSYALRLAGWDDARPVFTFSCPCQPFSAAGKGDGYADERHLWPHCYRLIRELRPPVAFAEQVAAAIRTGWLDDVCLSLESIGYAVGAVDFPACSIGAPHIRQRIYLVAESERGAAERHGRELGGATRGSESEGDQRQWLWPDARYGGEPVSVADAEHAERRSIGRSIEDERNRHDGGRPEAHGIAGTRREVRELADAGLSESARLGKYGGSGLREQAATRSREGGELGDARESGSQRRTHEDVRGARGRDERGIARCAGCAPSATNGFWRDAEWIACRDGKARPVESGTFPLAHGVPSRVVRLRGYGNAIVAEQARAFIEAFAEC